MRQIIQFNRHLATINDISNNECKLIVVDDYML